MGFCDLYAFNLAMLAKQGWKMLENPTSLMAQTYKVRYFPNGDILNASIGSNPSYAWRSIHKSIGLFSKEQDGEWEIGRQSIYGMIVVANTDNSKSHFPKERFWRLPYGIGLN